MADTPLEQEVPSPCVGICIVGAEGYCIGCFRSRDELQSWLLAKPAAKREILERCRERAEAEAARDAAGEQVSE